MKKSIAVGALVVTLVGGTMYGASYVLAQGSSMQGEHSTLIQKIADTFHLNKDDVQKVFDQNRQEKQSRMEARFEEKLSQDVSQGKLTEAQKQLIINKFKDLEANRQTFLSQLKNMTPQQRKAAIQQEKQSLEDWAKQNNIDMKYLFPGIWGHIRGMRGMHKMPGSQNTPTITPAV